MEKLQNFSNICVLSLWNSTEKRQYITDLFKKHHITNYFIDNAYDGTLVPGQFETSSGEIGRIISHLVAIREFALRSSEDKLFVVEDDLSINADSFRLVDEAVNNLSTDLVRLSSDTPVAYLITKDGAQKIVEKYFPADKRLMVNFNNTKNVEQVIFDYLDHVSVDAFSKNPNLPSNIKNTLDKNLSS